LVQEHAVKSRPPKRRISPVRDMLPPEVPEASAAPPEPAKEPDADPIPEHIRRMLEAAYT